VLIQGDSLSIIRDDVAGIVEACDQGDVGEAREAAALRQPGGGGVHPPEPGAAPDPPRRGDHLGGRIDGANLVTPRHEPPGETTGATGATADVEGGTSLLRQLPQQ
jgi:hypothetical protein